MIPDFNRSPQIPKKETKSKCRIRIKKSADGRIIDKETSGCSPSELRALEGNKEETAEE